MHTHTLDSGYAAAPSSAGADEEADVRALLRARTVRQRRAVLRHSVERSLHTRLFGDGPVTAGASPN
ncbi:hypothetical protein ACIPW5_26405 [Streptomyces sp. NPDC090077]|uniref:hypothetical protein n=1 Tax=Streptomyces sp. NPDC090077 TaxID=3365938 RepID=UPI0037F7280F